MREQSPAVGRTVRGEPHRVPQCLPCLRLGHMCEQQPGARAAVPRHMRAHRPPLHLHRVMPVHAFEAQSARRAGDAEKHGRPGLPRQAQHHRPRLLAQPAGGGCGGQFQNAQGQGIKLAHTVLAHQPFIHQREQHAPRRATVELGRGRDFGEPKRGPILAKSPQDGHRTADGPHRAVPAR